MLSSSCCGGKSDCPRALDRNAAQIRSPTEILWIRRIGYLASLAAICIYGLLTVPRRIQPSGSECNPSRFGLSREELSFAQCMLLRLGTDYCEHWEPP